MILAAAAGNGGVFQTDGGASSRLEGHPQVDWMVAAFLSHYPELKNQMVLTDTGRRLTRL
jgi:hypothetical protein